jgi:hypothetical protein
LAKIKGICQVWQKVGSAADGSDFLQKRLVFSLKSMQLESISHPGNGNPPHLLGRSGGENMFLQSKVS